MLLKSLKLENIRSYNSQNVNFSDGSTLLIGDIGSGKTTILLSIEFALFGLLKGDISGATLLRHGKKEGSVELHFEVDGKDIKIIRKLKRGKDDTISQDAGQIIVNNKAFDGTPIELKSRILELFGYPEELLNKNTSIIYRYTIYTPQEDMKRILFESKDDRLDTLRKIFNIDKYKRIRENALMYAKELRNTKKIYENKVQDLDVIKNSLDKNKESLEGYNKALDSENDIHSEIRKSHNTKKSELKNYEEQISALNILKKDQEIAIINLKNKKSELDKNNKELGMVEYRINDYIARLTGLGLIDQDENTIKQSLNEAEEKLSKINSAKEVISKRLEDKNRDLQNLIVEDVASMNYKLTAITKKLERKDFLEKDLEEFKKNYEDALIQLNIINTNKNNSIKIVNQLKDLNTCPLCLQNVDFSHKIKILDKENANIQGSERKMTELVSKKKDMEDSITRLKNELEELRRNELELNEIQMKLSNISKQQELRQQLEKEIEELNYKKEKLDGMDVNKLMDIISKSRRMLNGIEVKKHIEDSLREKNLQKKELQESNEKLTAELKENGERAEIINSEVMKYVDTEKEYNEKRKDLEKIMNELKDAEIKIMSTKKDIESAEKEIKRLNEEIESKNKIKDKITQINEMNYWITEHFINLTSTIEKAIMQKIHLEFNELFQKWFTMLIEDENIDVRVDEEFTPVITQNNYETDVVNLSGGEKTSVALAYRLALNKVINDLINNIKTKELLILDEPTDGFSSEQLDKMRDVLQELDMKQVIMVSHEAKMESYVQNIIRVSKNEHNSQIV